MINHPLSLCLSKEQLSILHDAQLLIIGAGGIGCELLKTLALSGFKHLCVVDLDTIDPTNLNRQFLFKKGDIGRSKSYVARDAIQRLCPEAKITAYHANINHPQFNQDFFKQFDVVLNALDNNEARRHVNRLCVSLGIPLVDSGSSGYNGQVTPILPGITKCFECDPLPRHKGFPVCSIRSVPQKPPHCVAWAKYFFQLLCGDTDTENLLYDTKQEFDILVNELKEKPDEHVIQKYIFQVFEKVFEKDVKKQIELSQISGKEINARPLNVLEYFYEDGQLKTSLTDKSEISCRTKSQPWSMLESVVIFVHSLTELTSTRFKTNKPLRFDKDDATCMNFVTAAATLRMYNYNIPVLSHWDVESISGSIIPAIASTNAILAGLQTLQTIKLTCCLHQKKKLHCQNISLQDCHQKEIKHIWVKQFCLGPFLLLPERLNAPKENCYVCQSKRVMVSLHNLESWTLQHYINMIIKEELGCKEPSVQFLQEDICIFDPSMEDSLSSEMAQKLFLPLTAWNITHGTWLYVLDTSGQEPLEFEVQILEDPSIQEKASTHEQFSSEKDPQNIPMSWLYKIHGFIADSNTPSSSKRCLDSSQFLQSLPAAKKQHEV